MKPDFLERLALKTGVFGRWYFILSSAFIGFIGGLTGGAILAGILSGIRNVELESDQVGAWVIVSCSISGAILTGRWCRRRLIQLNAKATEQAADGDA